MAEKSINNQGVKSKRDSFRERLASRYPDLDMNDEDAVYNQLSTDYDHYDQNKQRWMVSTRCCRNTLRHQVLLPEC